MVPLRIAYLIEDTGIAGGIRVAAAHADALIDRGHSATLVTRGGPLRWRESRAEWQHVESYDEVDPAAFDFVVGTFWTTLEPALRLAGERAVHLCQGYEGSFSGYRHLKEQIDAAYALPLPKITVSPHLVDVCRQFTDDATWIGQIVDDEFYQPHLGGHQPPRVLLVGPAQADFKGIDVGYDAIRQARREGADFELVRVSQWLPAEAEPTELVAQFHVGVSTAEMARLYSTADVFLAPSRSEEGFGLPAAEAMAGGVPAVLSEIPSFLAWGERHDYALFAPEGDGAAMATHLAHLLGDRELREKLSVRGREVVEQFRAPATGQRLERWFQGRLSASVRTRKSGR